MPRRPICFTGKPKAAVTIPFVLIVATTAAGCKSTTQAHKPPPSAVAVEQGAPNQGNKTQQTINKKQQQNQPPTENQKPDQNKKLSQKPNQKKTKKSPAKRKGYTPPPLHNSEILRVGEKLYYRIHWKEVVGAHANLEIKGRRTFSGKDVIELKANLKTVPAIDNVFKIRDEVISYWDPQSKLPLFTQKELNEGYYKKRYRALWEPAKNSVVFYRNHFKGNTKSLGEKNKKAKWKKKTKSVRHLRPFTQDLLSAVYFMRLYKELPATGQLVRIPVFDNGHKGFVKLRVMGRETVTVTAGTFPAVKLEPIVRKGYFKSKAGIRVWISDDERKLPLQAKARTKLIGDVSMELVSVR